VEAGPAPAQAGVPRSAQPAVAFGKNRLGMRPTRPTRPTRPMRPTRPTTYNLSMRTEPATLPTLALRWLPLVAWCGVIFLLSATPNLRIASADNVDFIVRKIGHMGVFGILAILFWRVLEPSRLRPAAAVWILSWLLTVGYAATDEFHQSFTAGRHASPVDVGIDAAGAALFLVGLQAWLKWRSLRQADRARSE
jgi:hypothetical protein